MAFATEFNFECFVVNGERHVSYSNFGALMLIDRQILKAGILFSHITIVSVNLSGVYLGNGVNYLTSNVANKP